MNPASQGHAPPATLARPLVVGLFGRLWRVVENRDGRQGILAVLDQGVVSGVNFLTAVFVGRVCGKEALGTYSAAWSLFLLLRGLQIEVLAAPFKVFRHQHADRATGYAGSAVASQGLLAGFSVIGLVLLTILLVLLDWEEMAWAVGVLALVAPCQMLREAVRQLALAQLEMAEVLSIDTSVAAMQVGGLGVLAWISLPTVPSVLAVSALACLCTLLGWWLLTQARFRIEPSRILADWRHDWEFARWMLCSYLVGSTIPFLVPWVVTLLRGEAVNGQLAACMTLINLAGTYVVGVASLVAPRAAQALAQGGRDALRRVLSGAVTLYVCTLVPFWLVILLGGDYLAGLVYGQEFSGFGNVLSILALHLLVNSLGMTAGSALWVIRRPQANFAADTTVLVVTLLALLTLVGPLGVLGAALATLVGGVVGLVVRYRSLWCQWKTLTPVAEEQLA